MDWQWQNSLGKKARMNLATGGEIGRGRVVAYCDAPMVCIEDEGRFTWWRAELCELLDNEIVLDDDQSRNDENKKEK